MDAAAARERNAASDKQSLQSMETVKALNRTIEQLMSQSLIDKSERTKVCSELESEQTHRREAENALVAAEKQIVTAEVARSEAVASLEHLESQCESALKIFATHKQELEVICASDNFLRGEVVVREVRLEQAREETKKALEETEEMKAAAATLAEKMEKAAADAYWRIQDLEDDLRAERAGRRAGKSRVP